jgi:hypothetical protein
MYRDYKSQFVKGQYYGRTILAGVKCPFLIPKELSHHEILHLVSRKIFTYPYLAKLDQYVIILNDNFRSASLNTRGSSIGAPNTYYTIQNITSLLPPYTKEMVKYRKIAK